MVDRTGHGVFGNRLGSVKLITTLQVGSETAIDDGSVGGGLLLVTAVSQELRGDDARPKW